jgi:hypothetical protein
MNIKLENYGFANISCCIYHFMSKKPNKELEKEWKKLEQDEMKEEDHQIELKEGYEQDEEYEKSED